jgi:hypothetical protein
MDQLHVGRALGRGAQRRADQVMEDARLPLTCS